MRTDDFVKFIFAREQHREWKEQGEDPRTWRNRKAYDPIIAEYRFCNVRRNDDRVTKWVHQNYLEPFSSSPYLWFALVVARLFNKEDTLKAIQSYVLPFKPKAMRAKLYELRGRGTIFNGAYIVSTNGLSMDKVDYVIDVLLVPLWKKRDKLTAALAKVSTLAGAHELLSQERGLGSFMAAQVLADWKYADDTRDWDDFNTFAASGPGSRRGLNRVMSKSIVSPWKEGIFRGQLDLLRRATNKMLGARKMEPLTAQDIQNCLCEFDKYERVRLGEGKPKQKYTPLEKKQ